MGNISVAWRSAVLACSLAALTACGGGSSGQGQDNSGAGADTPSTPVPTTAPTIGAGPQPQSATVGEVVRFGVIAGGTAPLAYQWLRDGVALAGAEAATYSVTAAEADHGAVFSVRVSNAAGQVTSDTAVLTVLITTAPPTAQLASGARLGAGNDGAAGFSLAVRADGRVLAWGDNTLAQLGGGSAVPGTLVMALPVLARAVSAGARHGLLVGQDGLVYGWGSTLWGELYPAGGAAGQQTVATPTALPGLAHATAVLASTGRSWALRDDGTVWHWPGVHNLGAPPYASFTLAPGQVSGITGTVRKIVRGGRSPNGGIADAFALTDDGKVWDITVTTTMAFPVTTHSAVASAVAALNGVRDLACGSNHCLALQGDGRVLAWGDNSFGQLGPAGTGNAYLAPAQVTGLAAAKAVAVLNAASLALLADGTVWTWGGGTQNGRGGAASAQPLALPQPQGVAELAASAGHVLLRLANGQVWGWGGNGSAELGDGSRLDRPSPVQAVGILLQ